MSRTRGFQSFSSSFQPALPLPGWRARGDKRGQASPEVIPGVSGRPASHLSEDGGAGIAAVLWQGWQQGDLRTGLALARRRESGQSHSKAPALFSEGQIPDGPKWPFCPHPLCCSKRRSQRWKTGAFSPLFSCVFKEGFKSKKKAYKAFFSPPLPSTKMQ